MSRAAAPSRRAMTLIAVLLVMGGAIVIATSLLFASQSQLAALAGAADAAQSRALAWSGIQAVMLRLDDQRSEILEGRLPRLDEQLTIYEAAGRLGVARLLPLGPGGARLVPEAAKLDLESADAPALAATGLVDEALAAAVIDHRKALGRPWQAVAELLDVTGMDAEILWGSVDEIASGAAATAETDTRRRGAPSAGLAEARGLADAVTVFSFEPALQRNGKLRINLNVPWSKELADRVAERFGQQASDTLRRVVESGTSFESEAKIFQVLNFFQVPTEDWPDIVDAFTTEAGEFHFGRMDINAAPYEALLALPDLGPERSAQIVQEREQLSDDERATIAWPALRGIIKGQEYEKLAGRITTRSWTYRLRLAAGAVDVDDPDGPLRGAVTWEAVIDLSSPRPRVAYLRDVSWLAQTAMVAAASSHLAEPPSDDEAVEVRAPASGPDPAADAPEAPASPPGQPAPVPGVSPGGAAPAPAASGPPAATPAAPAVRRRIGRWTAG